MSFLELFLIAVALSMDAFAVAMCKGLAMSKVTVRKASIVGAWFGAFQGLMPLLGWIIGTQFADKAFITEYASWIALILLCFIGINMIREALSKDEEEADCELCCKKMLPLAIATSIDALAVGVTFAFKQVDNILAVVCLIGVITFSLSFVGVKIGNIFGLRYKAKAEFCGGVILILMGILGVL